MTSRRSRNLNKPLSLYTSPIRELLYAAERYGSEFDNLPTEPVVRHLRECILIANQQTEIVECTLNMPYTSDEWTDLMARVRPALASSPFQEIYFYDTLQKHSFMAYST